MRGGFGWVVGLAAVAALGVAGCGGESDDGEGGGGAGGASIAEDAAEQHIADCAPAEQLPPTPDCQNAGSECAEDFYCISIFSTDRFECNPRPFLDRCPAGYCMTQSNSCSPSAGGTLCNSAEDCCDGMACIDGRCETR